VAFRAAALGNDGTTSAGARSFTITIPTSGPGGTVAAGDVALAIMSQNTGSAVFTAPSGWSPLSGPDDNSSNLRTLVWGKVLTAGDINTPLTFSSSSSGRLLGLITVTSGVTLTGALVALATDTNADSSWVSPPITTTGANWNIINLWAARNGSGSAVTGTLPANLTSDAVAQTNTTAPNYTLQASHLTTPGPKGPYGGDTATPKVGSTATATTDNIYTIALPASVATATVVGDTAVTTASSDSGTVSTGWTVVGKTASASAAAYPGALSTTPAVVVAGAAARVTISAAGGVVNPLPVPIVPAPSPVYPPDPYRAAIRNGGLSFTYLVDASRGGSPVVGATGLTPTGGTIVDTSKPGVRRTLNLELAPEPGLFDLLSPIGTTLTVTCRVTYQNRSTFDLPMGVYDVDSEKLSEGGGMLSVTAPDKWARIQRARFIGPVSAGRGLSVVEQIVALIQGALGTTETVSIQTSASAKVGTLTWDQDRDQAINSLAAQIGCWVYFDRLGQATIADIPTVGSNADWLVDASAQGVLITLDRERSRTTTRNVVVVTSTNSAGEKFPVQYVFDSDPASPTYAGPDPKNHPELAGPFGVVPYYFDTPIARTVGEGQLAGLAVLAKTVGLASQVSLTQVPNPAVDAFDVIDVLPPRERYDIARVLERHVVDTVTHPLVTDGTAQQIDGRSTRTDPYTS
jgi:hypothetical protein